MPEYYADIVIFGAGIAGLWTLKKLKEQGFDALLLEENAIGAGQTIASQGIIHSGLKYALAGKVSDLARSISAMPEIWRGEFKNSCIAAPSQQLFIPKGFVGGILKVAARKALGESRDIPPEEWPETIRASGFDGSVIHMSEPVLDIPRALQELAGPYKDHIRKPDHEIKFIIDTTGTIKGFHCGDHTIRAQHYIFTAAAGNMDLAKRLGHRGMETQARPLVMTMLKNAPFPLYAHFVGKSDKPVTTVTTHMSEDGKRVWYVGGGVAEHPQNKNPREVYEGVKTAFKKYMPAIDLSGMEWATLPIDRIEGTTAATWMPDTPVIHQVQNALYAWPTKLTFAPLLADRIAESLGHDNITPSGAGNDFSFLPEAPFAKTPWDSAAWTK
ncbi:MAG: FAD-binding oxidoreductase [Alphaproteobacteria bacterium]|nr:FAD-binding oxidoreductase [Alphaproteobacteria bacterium]